ncbi:MAG TPA: hypothetical protein VGB07_19730 [Blastocatellia bacterium]
MRRSVNIVFMQSSGDLKAKPSRGDKTICLPFESEEQYQNCLKVRKSYRQHLERMRTQYPELFPSEMEQGFRFFGSYQSKKQQQSLRRLQMKANKEVYQVRPSFLLPYQVARTDDVEKAIYLRQWDVPFEALAHVFGRDAMYWSDLIASFGRPSLLGATVKDTGKLPADLVSDEKHTRLNGKRVYLATTAAQGCILGASIAKSAGTEALTAAYGEFAAEARQINPDYAPQSICCDGWDATHKTWRALFSTITIIRCFLHSVLKIRDRCKKDKVLWDEIKERVWNAYHAETRRQFVQRLRRFREWATNSLPQGAIRQAVLALCLKRTEFTIAYDFPTAYRTSNTVDRLMDHQDRCLYARKYLRGNIAHATRVVRAHALLWNFHPYGARIRRTNPTRTSPAAELNGFQYHENWLHNLLIAASIGGRRAAST